MAMLKCQHLPRAIYGAPGVHLSIAVVGANEGSWSQGVLRLLQCESLRVGVGSGVRAGVLVEGEVVGIGAD